MNTLEHLTLSVIALSIKILSKNKLLIMNYHRVHNSQDLFFDSDLDGDSFNWQMQLISQYLIPSGLSDAMQKLDNEKLPGGSVVITFDDGYKDNIEAALPILQSNNIVATFFVATHFLNGGIMWNDVIIESIKQCDKDVINLQGIGLGEYPLGSKEEKLYAIEQTIKHVKYKNLEQRETALDVIKQTCAVELPNDLMMNDSEVVALFEAGMEIGGHTNKHPTLLSETDELVTEEISLGKEYLEKLLNTSLTSFAFPNGKSKLDYQDKHIKILEKIGFKYALTTNWGVNIKGEDPLELKRFTPWDNTKIGFLLRILKLHLFYK